MISRITAAFALLVVALATSAAPCWAQTYKRGDEIEVYFLDDWLPALVVNTNPRGDVMAEYEFAGRPHQRVFKATEVRHAFESGALARARMWSDASGKFKIRAALIDVAGENITLRKPDKSEVTIAVAKLSEGDKSFLKKLQKELGPIAPKAVDAEIFQEIGAWGQQAWGVDRVAITPDPMPAAVRVKQGGVVLPPGDFFDRLSAVLALGGQDSWVLAVTENNTPGGAKPSRLFWTSLAKGKVLGEQALPPGEIVMDYHTKSKRLLTWAAADGGSGTYVWGDVVLTLWSVMPKDDQPEAIIRWRVRVDNRAPREPWARIIDENTVLHRRENQEYVLWDVEAKAMTARFTQESFFGAPAALSAGKKYLALPEDRRVRIFDTSNGNAVTTLPANRGASGVAFSEDGSRLAVLSRNSLEVWDLTSADTPAEVYQAESIGTPFRATLTWLGRDRIMVSSDMRGLVLFSLPKKIPLWNYEFDWNALSEGNGRRLRDIVGGHLVYAATVGHGTRSGIAVGAVELPGPRVNEVDAQTTREQLLVMKAGSPVRLQLSCGEFQSRVEEALRKEVEKNGWVITPDAPNVLVAEMKLGETQSTTYRHFRTGETTTVTITPHVSSLQLKIGDQVAWQSGTSGGAPPMITLKEGESAQSEVEKWNKPSPGFFESVDIPQELLDPKRRSGLGTTEVTNRGLVPKAERPPTPMAASASTPTSTTP